MSIEPISDKFANAASVIRGLINFARIVIVPWKIATGIAEKARIQRETVEIAKRFREQEEQQKQGSPKEMQQGDYTQIQQNQKPQQIPQQPMQDFGGMEL